MDITDDQEERTWDELCEDLMRGLIALGDARPELAQLHERMDSEIGLMLRFGKELLASALTMQEDRVHVAAALQRFEEAWSMLRGAWYGACVCCRLAGIADNERPAPLALVVLPALELSLIANGEEEEQLSS